MMMMNAADIKTVTSPKHQLKPESSSVLQQMCFRAASKSSVVIFSVCLLSQLEEPPPPKFSVSVSHQSSRTQIRLVLLKEEKSKLQIKA